jgi:hypothetical protein
LALLIDASSDQFRRRCPSALEAEAAPPSRGIVCLLAGG